MKSSTFWEDVGGSEFGCELVISDNSDCVNNSLSARVTFSSKGFCRNPRGIFLNRVIILLGILRWIFGAFLLEKRTTNPPKHPQQYSNQKLGVSRPNFTLQGSALDTFRNLETVFRDPENPALQNHTWLLYSFGGSTGTQSIGSARAKI